MKRILVLLGMTACLAACGDNNVGNRTYQQNTPVDSANYPTTNQHDDTTATTNNNIYNPDSMPANTTIENKGGPSSQTTPGKENQIRESAGASVPQNNQPKPKEQ